MEKKFGYKRNASAYMSGHSPPHYIMTFQLVSLASVA